MPPSAHAYYQPSRKAPVTGVLVLLAGSAAAAVPLSIVYILAIRHIPFVYLNLLAVAGFGIGLGMLVAKLAAFGRLRSPAVAGALGLVAGGLACWLEWVFFAAFIVHQGGEVPLAPTYFGFLVNPRALAAFARLAAEQGTWSMKDGDPVRGVILVLIWIAEALVLIVPAVVFARGQAARPFSELLQRWAVSVKLPGRLPFFADLAGTRTRLESGDLLPLVTNEPAAGTAYASLELCRADGDPSCSYLSVANVTVSIDKKGRTQTATKPIVTHLRVPAELAQQLQELHSTALPT